MIKESKSNILAEEDAFHTVKLLYFTQVARLSVKDSSDGFPVVARAYPSVSPDALCQMLSVIASST
jgi:hypothetical protein